MEIKDLELRIEKKMADIEKTKRSINKFITKNNFSEEDQEFARTRTWKEIEAYSKANWPGDYYKHADFGDLRRRYNTLEEQETQLQKYNNQLTLMKAKEDREASTEKIQVIVEFLENWKQDVIKYVEDNVKFVNDYFTFNSEYVNLYNNRWGMIRRGEATEEEIKQKLTELKIKEKQAQQNINPITSSVYSYRDKTINYDKLNNILDKDIQSKYWTMVDKVTAITGDIVDASGLRIAGDGNLNGIIVGNKGKARLETILAGGYNQNIIVNTKHGQILHYRLLVHEIK